VNAYGSGISLATPSLHRSQDHRHPAVRDGAQEYRYGMATLCIGGGQAWPWYERSRVSPLPYWDTSSIGGRLVAGAAPVPLQLSQMIVFIPASA